MLGAFIGPLCLAMAVNVVAFVLIMNALLQASRARNQGPGLKQDDNQRWRELRATMSIFAVLGLGWIFGALINTGPSASSLPFQYIFTAFTTLQGFAIFIFHCVLNKQVRKALTDLVRGAPALTSSAAAAATSKKTRSPVVGRRADNSHDARKAVGASQWSRQQTDVTLLNYDPSDPTPTSLSGGGDAGIHETRLDSVTQPPPRGHGAPLAAPCEAISEVLVDIDTASPPADGCGHDDSDGHRDHSDAVGDTSFTADEAAVAGRWMPGCDAVAPPARNEQDTLYDGTRDGQPDFTIVQASVGQRFIPTAGMRLIPSGAYDAMPGPKLHLPRTSLLETSTRTSITP